MKRLSKKIRVVSAALAMVLGLGSGVGYAGESLYSFNNQMYTDHIVFSVDSNEIYHNDQLFLSNNPNTVRKGVTYISLRVFAERLGLSVAYDNTTKEATISNEKIKLKFKANQSQYQVNQQIMTSTHGVPFIENATTMVPLRVFTNHFGMKVEPELQKKSIHLYWSKGPIAKFSVQPNKIYAGQTEVTYIDEYQHPQNLAMTNEEWQWNKEVFTEPGVYKVTRIVQDEKGVWSQPYVVEVNVLPPNQAPVASFTTLKGKYMIGEPISYINTSTDDENAITKTTWTNKEPAFFTAGEKEVVIEVEDQHGLKSTYSRKILIENKVLYTKEEFDPWFTPVGGKFPLWGQNIILNPKIQYDIEGEEYLLYRSNSPEAIKEEGIYYGDIIQGKARLLLHKQNHRGNPVHLYIVATNNNEAPVEIKMPHFGMGGPHEMVTTTGKFGLARYLKSLSEPRESSIILAPGESKVILSETSSKKILEKQTLSVFADIDTSLPVQIQTVVVDTGKDVLKELPTLPQLPKDGIHTRGSFPQGNRSISINELLGTETKRIVFGDPKEDPTVAGFDQMTGEEIVNPGNYGVLYKLKLERVAPRSLILVNARGGHYSGAFLVNNEVVMVSDGTHLLDSKELGVLYRSGDQEEEVEIVFIPASGSNLPINIVLQPLPEKRH